MRTHSRSKRICSRIEAHTQQMEALMRIAELHNQSLKTDGEHIRELARITKLHHDRLERFDEGRN